MVVFALTGGSGAGKSTAAEAFRKEGVYVIDADKIARNVTEKGKPCLSELAEEFGDGIVREDGSLDRLGLGELVFSDEKKLKSLNKITHKYIKAEIMRILSELSCPVAAIDGAVIIGSEIEELCDFVVSVIADEKTRIGRITARDGISRELAENRLKSQPDENFYISRSRLVIRNDGDEEALAAQVKEICRKIREEEAFG